MSLKPDRQWSLTGQALARLLERLGEQPEAAAREYDAIRGKLVDETIDRVARRLEEGETIEHVRAYFYGVAKRVAIEWKRRRAAEGTAIDRQRACLAADEAPEAREARVACLESCLRHLPPHSRELILGYYRGQGGERKRLAKSLGMTYTSLKTRAHRIRSALGECLRECLEAQTR